MPGDGHAEFHHDAFVRRAAVDHREEPVGVAHVAQVGLADAVRPAGGGAVDLVVAGKRFPDVGAHGLQRCYERRQRPLALLG